MGGKAAVEKGEIVPTLTHDRALVGARSKLFEFRKRIWLHRLYFAFITNLKSDQVF